jgi:hypothetical protein
MGTLSGRERAMVADVGRVRTMSGGQLIRLHFAADLSGKRHGQRVLTSLVERRVLARVDRRIGGVRAGSEAYIYRLDVIGQRLLGPLVRTPPRWDIGESFVRHALMVSECYALLGMAAKTGEIELLAFDSEPTCWRTFVSRRGATETLKPDAFVKLAVGDFEDSWFVECDRGTEDLGRIRSKIAGYVRYWDSGKEEPFPLVLWVTTRAERATALSIVVESLPSEQRGLFTVCQIDGFIQRVKAGAGDWDAGGGTT